MCSQLQLIHSVYMLISELCRAEIGSLCMALMITLVFSTTYQCTKVVEHMFTNSTHVGYPRSVLMLQPRALYSSKDPNSSATMVIFLQICPSVACAKSTHKATIKKKKNGKKLLALNPPRSKLEDEGHVSMESLTNLPCKSPTGQLVGGSVSPS